MRIWANHAHVYPAGAREEATFEKLLPYLDRCEIEGAVAFAPLRRHVEHLGLEPNRWLVEAAAPWRSRFELFGTIDLGGQRVGKQVRAIHELGMKGIKIHTPGQRTSILSDALLEVYAEAERLDLFISFHTGPHRYRLASLRLIDFDEITRQFPRLRYSLEHVGGFAEFHEAVGVIQNNQHRPHSRGKGPVYAGLTTVFTRRSRAYYLSPDMIEELVFRVGDDHIIFGLDFPGKSLAESLEALQIVRDLHIPDASKEKILGNTLRKQLDIP